MADERQSTHWQGCWRTDGHHACAIVLLDLILSDKEWAADCAELGCDIPGCDHRRSTRGYDMKPGHSSRSGTPQEA